MIVFPKPLESKITSTHLQMNPSPAWNEGFYDYVKGVSLDKNPYTKVKHTSSNYDDWISGWKYAQELND